MDGLPGSQTYLRVGNQTYTLHSLQAIYRAWPGSARLPYSVKILLENVFRTGNGGPEAVAALAHLDPRRPPREVHFLPARVLLRDRAGEAVLVDLAALRQAVHARGGEAGCVNPLLPADLVIDHPVPVDPFGSSRALDNHVRRDYARNRERGTLLRWAERAFRNLRILPPETGSVHRVNLEVLARVVFVREAGEGPPAVYPDTVVGTDSHTTMVNGLGVLGWCVGGLEAEAALFEQSLALAVPPVVGVRVRGRLPEGAITADLVRTVAQQLQAHGVVGRLVEFFGEGLAGLSVPDRATLATLAPEHGATCAFFPVDAETLSYLRLTGRPEPQVRLVEAYTREQGLFAAPGDPEPIYAETLDLDLGAVEPSAARPGRPQDRVPRWDGEVRDAVVRVVRPEAFQGQEPGHAPAEDLGQGLPAGSDLFAWEPGSTYLQPPAYLENLPAQPPPPRDVRGARVLLALGDGITTDHISPGGALDLAGPAGRYLRECGVPPAEFGSCDAYRGNHEMMVRATFANPHLRNRLCPGTTGGKTRHLPGGEILSVFDAAARYTAGRVPLLLLAGRDYGTPACADRSACHDWAARGPFLLGVRAVLAESFERTHRTDLVAVGILPLQFRPGEGAARLGLSGEEVYDVEGVAGRVKAGVPGGEVTVRVRGPGGRQTAFSTLLRLDTPQEVAYYHHGGILSFLLRQLLAGRSRPETPHTPMPRPSVGLGGRAAPDRV